MDHHEFKIGMEFLCGDRRWRVTDIGTRVVVAIRLDEVEKTTEDRGQRTTEILIREQAEAEGWFNGPPYAVAEIVFDEYDLEGCEPV